MAFEIRKSQERETGEMMLTREEKEALLDQKIQRMKIKNAERMKKFQEIEEDKKWAEREGRAVTLKHRDFSDNEDESWPKRADRFEDVDEDGYQQTDLRKVLQNRKNETKVVQEPQPDSGRRQNTSKYKSIIADGPPPDPAYNYLADRDRDTYAEKKDDNKFRRGFQRKTRGDQRQNQQGAGHQGHNRSQRPFDESGNEEPRENYNHWRKERDHIDRERIQRQKTKEGWKREWDWNKHENQSDDSKLLASVVPPNLDVVQKNFGNSGESHFRGTAGRGGRGRGRLRPDMRSGSTPDREIGINYQKSPRFRNSPDDQRSGNMMKQESEQGSTGVASHSVGPSGVDTVSQNLHREPVRSTVMPLADVAVNPNVKNYNAKGSIMITVGNQGCDGNGEEVTRTIQSKDAGVPDRSLDLKTKTEFLTHAQFSKSPKKGIGSGRIVPPQKGRPVVRGKDASRRALPKGRRFGNRNSTGESESEEVTIGIAVITTPGDKVELATEANDIVKGAEKVNFIDISVKKGLESPDNTAKSMDLLEGELEEDDDDDEWEDVEEGSVEIDDNLKRELNKSNESIHRFIEENTLHPDGTNWNIGVDGDVIPWSEQVDAESQERHRRENEYLKPSDSFVDTSFQSSCSIVESPYEQSEILSSLLAAACNSPEGPCIGPCTSASNGTKSYPEYQVDGNIAMQDNLSANSDKTDGAHLQESLEPNRMLSNPQAQVPTASGTIVTHDAVTSDVDPASDLCESFTSGSVVNHSKTSDSSDQELEAIKPSEDLPSDIRECEVRTVESSAIESVSNPVGEEILPSSDASSTDAYSLALNFSESQQEPSSAQVTQ